MNASASRLLLLEGATLAAVAAARAEAPAFPLTVSIEGHHLVDRPSLRIQGATR